jgi:hypothetical protein
MRACHQVYEVIDGYPQADILPRWLRYTRRQYRPNAGGGGSQMHRGSDPHIAVSVAVLGVNMNDPELTPTLGDFCRKVSSRNVSLSRTPAALCTGRCCIVWYLKLTGRLPSDDADSDAVDVFPCHRDMDVRCAGTITKNALISFRARPSSTAA